MDHVASMPVHWLAAVLVQLGPRAPLGLPVPLVRLAQAAPALWGLLGRLVPLVRLAPAALAL